MDLDKKYQQLQRENSALQSQVQEKEQKLLKLRTGAYLIFGNHLLEYRVSRKNINSIQSFLVSEAVCKEYEQLKNQYDVETNAMHKAMQQASQVMMHLCLFLSTHVYKMIYNHLTNRIIHHFIISGIDKTASSNEDPKLLHKNCYIAIRKSC